METIKTHKLFFSAYVFLSIVALVAIGNREGVLYSSAIISIFTMVILFLASSKNLRSDHAGLLLFIVAYLVVLVLSQFSSIYIKQGVFGLNTFDQAIRFSFDVLLNNNTGYGGLLLDETSSRFVTVQWWLGALFAFIFFDLIKNLRIAGGLLKRKKVREELERQERKIDRIRNRN